MFKNLILYRITPDWLPDGVALETAMDRTRFVPCGATQVASAGWVEPRGQHHGALLEVVGGQWLLKLAFERKAVPVDVLKRRVDEMAEQIEKQTGRKPGKKQKKELKEDALQELLPQAFPKRSTVQIWIDPVRRLLAVDAASLTRADDAVTCLVKCADGMGVTLLTTAETPAAVMSAWLHHEDGAPEQFTIDRECELKAPDESKSVVRYARHALDIDEVRQHIANGKVPTHMAITWAGRVSFVLGSNLQLRKVQFLDIVFEGRGRGDGDDAFDADAAIATGELQRLVPDLLAALGGEYVAPIETAPPEATAASSAPVADVDADVLLADARRLVVEHKRASISLIQRHLRIGYNRAARLLDALEIEGVVSSEDRVGNREVCAA